MEEFENLGLSQLRKILVDTIIDAKGKYYALGWLHSAYTYGNPRIDEDRDHLISKICEYRALKDATLAA